MKNWKKGQLGHDNSIEPQIVSSLEGKEIISVSAGGFHNLALNSKYFIQTFLFFFILFFICEK